MKTTPSWNCEFSPCQIEGEFFSNNDFCSPRYLEEQFGKWKNQENCIVDGYLQFSLTRKKYVPKVFWFYIELKAEWKKRRFYHYFVFEGQF